MLLKVPGSFYLPLLLFPQISGVAWMWRDCDACDTWAPVNARSAGRGAPHHPPTPPFPGVGDPEAATPGASKLGGPSNTPPGELGRLSTPARPAGAPLPTPPPPRSRGWGTRRPQRLALYSPFSMSACVCEFSHS